MSKHAPGWRPFLALCPFCPLLCLAPRGSWDPLKGRTEMLPFAVLHFVKGKCRWGEVVLSVGFFVGYVPVEIKKKKKIQRGRFDLFRKQ